MSLGDIEQIYMVRDVAFGSDFNSKLFLSVITIAMVAWDRVTNRRWDYLWVFLTGTVIWTLVELSLQLGGTRVMPERILFGAELPLALSAPLQGMSEGAFIAVLGIFLGDRILRKSTRPQTWIALGLVCALVAFLLLLQSAAHPGAAETVASRRAMLTPGVLVLIGVVVFDAWFWWRRPQFRSRSVVMTLVMLIFAASWTAASVATGARWVEVESAISAGFQPAPTGIAVATLTYDVVVEIALAYVPFFAIPALLGLVTRWPPESGSLPAR